MVDIFALSLSHGLLLIALLRLVRRGDLDREDVAPVRATAAREGRRRD